MKICPFLKGAFLIGGCFLGGALFANDPPPPFHLDTDSPRSHIALTPSVVDSTAVDSTAYCVVSDSESSRLHSNPLAVSDTHRVYIMELESAASQGDSEALMRLGHCYAEGKYVTRSPEKSARCFKEAAQQGHPRALYNLGLCYEKGFGVECAPRVAFECFKLAAERHVPQAQYSYGVYLSRGVEADTVFNLPEIVPNLPKALDVFASADTSMRPLAQREIGILYISHPDYRDAREKGVAILRMLASDSDRVSCRYLGDYFMQFADTESQKNAFAFFKQGYHLSDIESTAKLAFCLEKGIGTLPQVAAALQLYELAVEGRSTFAMTSLADYFIKLDAPTERQLDMAISLLLLASTAGDPLGVYMLGVCAYQGIGQLVDYDLARELFERAATLNGYAPAEYNLAMMYLEGIGVTENVKKGFEWLEKAANQNYSEAMVKYAACLINGIGTRADVEYGLHILRKAARLGNVEATLLIERIINTESTKIPLNIPGKTPRTSLPAPQSEVGAPR